MRLLPLFVCAFLASCLSVRAADQTIDLGGGHAAILTVPDGWKTEKPDLPAEVNQSGHLIRLVPKNGANTEVIISLSIDDDKSRADPEGLRSARRDKVEPKLPGSVETKADVQDFKTPHGSGCMTTITDAKLVGQPPKPGDYKVATIILLRLADQVVANAMLFFDDPKIPEHDAMLAALRSLAVKEKGVSI